jgi:pilus assembly protein FimV
MAYNKSKFVEAAQKLLNQGKVAQAIAEYQQILKHEPRDQVTLMTVGELYIRQGETFQAIDYFERLAQIFVGDGFLTKAIAVYKRIAKLAPEEIRPLEKLADLYVQQGVMSEARPLFLQLAEIHLKNNRQPEAVALLKKLLMAEPDNLRIQVRLADLYQAMGQNREAIDAYIAASQRALARGDQAECEKLADKVLKLDPNNLAALIVKARVHSLQGNFAQAAEVLEKVPDLEKGGEQAELLLDLYLKSVKWDQASDLALRIFQADPKNYGPAQKIVEALLESGHGDKAMAVLDRTRIPMIDAGEHEVVGKLLNELAERLPGRIEPLEWLVETYGRTSDSFRLPDALAHLGDALVADKQYDRAKQVFEQLVDREPESDPAKRKLNDVLRKMGLLGADVAPPAVEPHAAVELAMPPAPKVRPDFEPLAPEVRANPITPSVAVETPLDEDTQKFIAQSLTDVDLFASYGLTQKAIGLLEAILRRAPRHTPTLEKLLDFVLGAGDDRRTAELAAKLEQISSERGDARGSERFGELRRRFQRAAGLSDEELLGPAAQSSDAQAESEESVPEITSEPSITEFAMAEESVGIEPAEPEPGPAITSAAEGVREVDLSDEWASMLEETRPVETSTPAPAAHGEAQQEFELPTETLTPLEPSVEQFSVTEEPAAEPEPAAEGSQHADFEIPAETPAPAHVEEIEPETPSFAELTAPETAASNVAVPEQPVAETPEGVQEFPLTLEEPAAPPVANEAPAVGELPAYEATPEPAVYEAAPEPPVTAEQPAAKIPEPEAARKIKDPEIELDQDYELVLDPEPLVPAYDQKPPETPIVSLEPEAEPVTQNAAPTNGFASDQFLSDLANEIDQLGIGQLSPGFSGSTPAAEAAASHGNAAKAEPAPVSPADVGPLKEVFDEFRAELGEMGVDADDEDLETHYNLGIAFREMGLLEEAISEFQKVAKAAERGRPFRYCMQCYTLLGLAFIDRGQPSIAAMWYERALHLPDIEPESELALRYDLGMAQESAGESEAALKSFSQVYAVNIDYRDVGERIAALQKPTR